MSWKLFPLVSLVCISLVEAREFMVVGSGKPQATIVTPAAPSRHTQDAVKELNYWIARITGHELPVMTEDEWQGEGRYIAVGESGLTRSNGWSIEALPPEGARVIIEEGKMGLIGRPPILSNTTWRGIDNVYRPLASGEGYAVMEFVHGHLGVRLIWPGPLGEVYRSRKDLSAPVGERVWAPKLTHARFMYNGVGVGRMKNHMKPFLTAEAMPVAAWKQREDEAEMLLHRKRMNWPVGISFRETEIDWWDRYAGKHPDWFARPPTGITQQGGHGVKLNLTHPGVHEEKIRLFKALRDSNPGRYRHLDATPNDSRGFCTRPESRAWDAEAMRDLPDEAIWNSDDARLTDRYVRFWNLLGEKVRELEPEGGVSTLAYRNYRKPPLTEKIIGNLYVAYVGGEGFYPDEPYILKEWKEWREKGAKMIWRPNVFHCGHAIPYLYPQKLHHDFQKLMEYGMLGISFDSIVGNWAGQGLNYYLITELSYRTDATKEMLLDEYFSAFGEAAEAMRRYHLYFEEVTARGPTLLREHQLVKRETWGGWWNAHIQLVPLLLTPEVLTKADAILIEAEAMVDIGKIEGQRVAFIRRGFDHTRLMTETFTKLGFGDARKRLRGVERKELLKPLWEMRMRLLSDHAVSVQWAFYHEQRTSGLWSDYLVSNQPTSGNRLPLLKGWAIRLDPELVGLKEGWQKNAFADTPEWQEVDVSMPWRRALNLPSGETKNSAAVWYRVKFPTPDLGDMKNQVRLHFGSVDAETHIWVNGKLVAERGFPHQKNYDSWRESFEVNVTDAIQGNGWNEMVVRVGSTSENAGITGPVSINTD